MRLSLKQTQSCRPLLIAAAIALLVIITSILYFVATRQAEAQFVQDDNNGQWSLSFQNNAGIAANVGVTVNGTAATATIPSGATGNLLTSTIQPPSFSAWNQLSVEGTWGNPNDIKVQLYTCGATPTLLPANILSVTGQGDNTNGYTLIGGKLDISSLNKSTYPCIQTRVLLSNTNGGSAPVIRKVTVSWQPLTVFLIRATAPTTKKVGEKINYVVDYSVNYSNDQNVVVWLPAPTAQAGTFTPAYGQNLTTDFVSASNGGQFTSTALVINGISIPANSVYWNLGAQTAGTTGSLSADFSTKNGTQNGVVYASQAHIDSPRSDEVFSDSSTAATGNQVTSTTMQATPAAGLKKLAGGVITMDGINHVYSGSPYNSRVSYTIVPSNSGGSVGVETIFNSVTVDNLSDIFTKLSSVACGSVGSPPGRISLISDGGVLDVAAKTITWASGHLVPSASKSFTFTVDYSGCADATIITNTVGLSGDNITPLSAVAPVTIGVDPTPRGIYAKGDRTKVPGTNPGISALIDNNRPSSNDPTDLAGKTVYGDTTTYLLQAVNTGIVRLDGTVMRDMVPVGTEFVSASLPSSAAGTVYYATTTSFTNPAAAPSFDGLNPANPGADWSTTLPSDPATVRWVAYYIPCIQSGSIAASGSCANKPSSVVAELTVRVVTPADVCSVYDIQNTGLFSTYRAATNPTLQSDADVSNLVTPLGATDTGELTHVVPPLATFKQSSSISGPSSLQPGQIGSYTLSIINSGSALAQDTLVTLAIPTVDVGGIATPIDFVDFTGAPYTKTYDGNGKVTSISISPGDIPAGADRSFTLKLAAPKGVKQSSSMTVTAVITAHDPGNCRQTNQSVATETTINGLPVLDVFKTRDESLINSAGDIHYQLNFTSSGKTPTTDTFVIDRLPAKAVFKEAYTNGTGLDANLNNYNCVNCKVYFSRGQSPLPPNLTATSPLTPADIYNNFSLGIQTSAGKWQPPATMNPNEVVYVAYLVDNTNLTNPQLNAGASGKVGLTVTNDDNAGDAGTAGSTPGTVLYNYGGIVANESLQSIGNSVTTTILTDPGLIIDKVVDKPVISAGESFNWRISYHNDSSSNDTSATITDTLPYGVSLTGIYSSWNTIAQTHGLGAVETAITNNPAVSIVTNPDGTTTVTINISQALRGGDLQPQEGGELRFAVTADASLASNTRLNNTARACYSDDQAGPFCSDDEAATQVQNPDLWLRKNVSNTAPKAGESIVYSLVISNEGLHDAPNVVITDTMPAGICFDEMNLVTPSGWTLGVPIVTGGPCATAPTTLTWSAATGNALKRNDLASAVIPGNSEDITVQYKVTVNGAVTPGTSLTNGANVSTNIPEDPLYPNSDDKEIITPIPDPYVRKRVTSPVVTPGENFDYTIEYGNNSRETAQGVYIVDGLPDYNGDGKTDITIVGAIGAHNEKIYYYDENSSPALSTLGIGATYNYSGNSNFKTSPSQFAAGSYATHMVIVNVGTVTGTLGELEGPYSILVQAQATDPYTVAKLPSGVVLVNHVEINSTTTDSDQTNNQDDAITRTPSADLAIIKQGDPEGSYPGVAPGGQINYTITWRNGGSTSVCSVWMQEVYPAQLTNISQDATQLQLFDAADQPVLPVDPVGNPISQAIKIEYNAASHRWQIGSADSVTYTNVCIPAGAHAVFHISATVSDTTPDGTQIHNVITIGEDSPAVEDTLANNVDDSTTTVYRADLKITKEGVTGGADGILGTADDSSTLANPNDKVRYTLGYNNVGNLDAVNAKIDEVIPEGICFTIGSVANVPAGATVVYSNDNGSTFTYAPTGTAGATDCNVTHFRVQFGTLPAPANLAAGVNNVTAVTQEFMGGVIDIASSDNAGSGAIAVYAVKTDGSLWAWGSNYYGEIGNGIVGVSEDTPVQVIASDVVSVDVFNISDNGYTAVYAVKTDGSLWAWGNNSYGQVGNGTNATQLTPTQIISSGVASISINQNTGTIYVVKTDGSLWAWGYNDTGQVGNGTTTDQITPTQIISSGVSSVTATSQSFDGSAYAIKTDGSLWAWGDNSSGQVGNGTTGLQLTPTQIISSSVSSVAASYSSTYAIKTDGSLWAWGDNGFAQLGNGTLGGSQLTPTQIISSGVSSVTVDSYMAEYAIKTDGSLWAWGYNATGQVGNGSGTIQLTPTQIISGGVSSFTLATDGYNVNSYVIKTDGSLWAWGDNSSGQVGNGSGSNPNAPTQIISSGVGSVTAIKGNSEGSTYVIKTDGSLWAWGHNTSGQVGNGTIFNQYTPTQIISTNSFDSVSPFKDIAYAIKTDGSLWAWGSNGGRVGNGTTVDQLSPVHVLGTGYVQFTPASGTVSIPLSAATPPSAWKNLYFTTDSDGVEWPAGSGVTYSLMQANCTTPIAGFQNLSGAAPVDINSLPPSTTNYCLKVDYTNLPTTSFTARMSYTSTVDPYVTFDGVVDADISRSSIDNLASISTDTAEIRYDNNADDHHFRVPNADLEVIKDVDKASINLSQVAANAPLTYTVTVKNNGSSEAIRPVLKDTLPAGMTYQSGVQTSGPGGFAVSTVGQIISFSSATQLAVGEVAVFTITATVDSGATNGTQFYNDACVSAATADTSQDNNCDSATTVVGDYANVYIHKTGPAKANIDKNITYTLAYGNNGNIDATNWSVSDPLNTNVDFVSATQTAGSPALTCSEVSGTVTCTPVAGAALPVGSTGSITLVVKVHNDQALADTNTVITNNACIATTTAQTIIGDDCSETNTTVRLGDLAGFGGRVFLDFDSDVLYDAGTDKPLGNVAVYGSGYDTTGRIYGPAVDDPHYTAVMTDLLPILISEGVVPAGTTVTQLSASPQYVVLTPKSSDSQGNYSYAGLYPGTYYVHEVQPVPYASTGSTGGYLSTNSNGLPQASPQDGKGSVQTGQSGDLNRINTIILQDSDFSIENNFGELPGAIGNHIWKDRNDNGAFDAATEVGFPGIEVTLYKDVDGNGLFSPGVDTVAGITRTDADGYYGFTGLDLDNGTGSQKYVVVVSDTSSSLNGYTNTTGASGVDDNSQKATGYPVTLSPTVTGNSTADFGYFRPIQLVLNKLVDGNNDGTFATMEQIQPEHAFTYRITVGNTSLEEATGVTVSDQLPAGVTLLSVVPSQGTTNLTAGLSPNLTWTIGTIEPTAVKTLDLTVIVHTVDVGVYAAAGSTSRNIAQIATANEPDSNSTPGNASTPFDSNSHEDDEDNADTFMTAALGDYVWIDYDNNGRQDVGEPGLNGVTVELRDSTNAVVATTTTQANAGQDGYYTFGGLTPGENYTIHFVRPTGYVASPENAAGALADQDSDANTTTGSTAPVVVSAGEYNQTIDAGFTPLLVIGDTVWSDSNNNGIQDTDEAGIANVPLMLYEDSDTNGVLDVNNDTLLDSTTTDANGLYRFSGLNPGSYFVTISGATLGVNQVLAGYAPSAIVGTDPNTNVDTNNDGSINGLFISSQLPLTINYGIGPQANGTANLTYDFGFYKAPIVTPSVDEPGTPTAPSAPSTGFESIARWYIILDAISGILIGVVLCSILASKQRRIQQER